MARKCHVMIEVDPDKETVIKPFGEKVSESASVLPGAEKGTCSATCSSTSAGTDADVDSD